MLADLLQDPLPAEFAEQGGEDFVRLCDLDERAWKRFDGEGCKALASEVVRAVGRAARQPLSFTALQLPPMPEGMTLANLELESRTFNCLTAAGIGDRPQDLGRMTIEGVLALRGFWGKCLVDLLTSIEYATDHPEVRGKARRTRLAGPKNRKTFGHYPRRGYRLAPDTLREILDVPVPGREIASPEIRGLQLCDLDENVSQNLTDDELALLGRSIITRVNVSSHKRIVRERKLPTPPKGMRLQDLALENRTYNCLAREGLTARFEDIGKYTIGDLLGLKAFGAKCLLDLLSSLETALARSDSLHDGLTQAALTLGEKPEASQVHFSDPRLGPMVRAIDREADTLNDLAARIVNRRVDPPDPDVVVQQLAEICQRIDELSQVDLGTELADIFAPPSPPRDREIISEYYGWDGGERRTLEDLGNRHGLSRERIRQVCLRAAKRHGHARVFAPALDRTLELVRTRMPIATPDLNRAYVEAGLKPPFLTPQTIRQAAEFLARDSQFTTVKVGEAELVVDAKAAHLPKSISQVARRIAVASGIATVSDVSQQLKDRQSARLEPALIRAVLEMMPHFQWLDKERTWFHLESGSQYGLPNMLEKVLSVCPRIEVTKLRTALGRHRRSARRVPPSRVLLAFCEQLPEITVEERAVVAESPRSEEEALSGVEASMVRILREHGPVLERGAFEELCLADGMNRFSFNATLMASPVIAQLGRSVYGLVGSQVSRRKVRSLAAKSSSRPVPRVLRSFGTLADGRVYLSYQLSKAAISGGVTTVPAGLKERLQGSFQIRTADGEEAGKLVARGGCAWGLGPALRSQRARVGDYMVLLIDGERGSADVYLGERDLLDALIESLSLQVAERWKTEDLATVSER